MFKTVVHWYEYYDGTSVRYDCDSGLGISFDNIEALANYHRTVFLSRPSVRSVLAYVQDVEGGFRHVTITRDDYVVVSHHHFSQPLNYSNYVFQKQTKTN